jgi:stage II sporulation SpoE-like protein
MRNWLVVLLIALPSALDGQNGPFVRVPDSQCIYWLGDKPAWTAAVADPSDARPYSEYHMTGDATVVWVRCRGALDMTGIQHPALVIGSNTAGSKQVYFDRRPVEKVDNYPLFPIAAFAGGSIHTIDVRVAQYPLPPGDTPGRPVYVYVTDVPFTEQLIEAQRGENLRELVPAYSGYLVIGTAGLFLLGLFFFDRSQKAAFWLGLYCAAVGITRLSMMGSFFFDNYPSYLQSTLFGLSMFESWALVRVNFALGQRRVPAVYWVVFAAWVFIFVGSVLPVLLPVREALPLSLFVQVTCFKPIWCIWTFACTAPFLAFWPWTQLSRRMRTVAALCAVWAVIEGWFQLQQVIFNRETWRGPVQNLMSLAIVCLIVALFGHIFHQQRIAADERAEMRGELTAARQVQHLLIPDKMQVTPGVTVSSAFLPAHEVGGDFYLCRALPNGAQRVLLGDVSGKGVAAALTSALLLGAADRCDDLRPAAVLQELNAALRNSGIEGFTTCLCADLASTGVLLIANAGQLPPYRNGQEIEIPAGLPLGVDAAADYAESSLQLAPGDKLTFLSDGVVEARNAVGELFGFERTRQVSSRAAQQIADAAVNFGQQDDITVLTLSLAALPASA